VRRVIILGHTGFIGQALLSHLQADGRTEVLGFSSRTLDLRRTESLKTLEGLVGASTTVVFASAITREKGDSLEKLSDNIAMAGHLGAFLESHPPAKCICFSSDAVYPMQNDPISEETPVAPGGTFYAIGKYAAECVLRRSAALKNVPLLVLRPTGVFGPGDTHNSYGPNAFLRAVVRDRSIRLFGEGEERRDHLYIGDLVRLVSRLIETDAVGVYNLATGISRSFAEIVEVMRRVVPFEFTVSRIPRNGSVTHRAFDIARLAKCLPDFRFTNLEQGLREIFRHLSEPIERV
jgi:UDP-glucose 4-epimerase